MTAFLEVSIEGQDKWRRRLVGVQALIDDFTKLGEALTPVVYLHLGEWFDSAGEGTWQPLSPAYAAWKAAHYPGAPIMVQTGELSASLHGPGGKFSVIHIGRDGGEWGTRAPYARAHQHGAPDRGLPARPLIVKTDGFRRDFITASRAWLRANARAA